MSKRVITSDELIAMDNDEVAIELFFLIVQHGEKSLCDVHEIAAGIRMHAEEIERRIQAKRKGSE